MRCAGMAALQCEQRAKQLLVMAWWERRIRRRILLVFFFGTAMGRLLAACSDSALPGRAASWRHADIAWWGRLCHDLKIFHPLSEICEFSSWWTRHTCQLHSRTFVHQRLRLPRRSCQALGRPWPAQQPGSWPSAPGSLSGHRGCVHGPVPVSHPRN